MGGVDRRFRRVHECLESFRILPDRLELVHDRVDLGLGNIMVATLRARALNRQPGRIRIDAGASLGARPR
jgi:hypothetical protein